jgi:hypothetical protein
VAGMASKCVSCQSSREEDLSNRKRRHGWKHESG